MQQVIRKGTIKKKLSVKNLADAAVSEEEMYTGRRKNEEIDAMGKLWRI